MQWILLEIVVVVCFEWDISKKEIWIYRLYPCKTCYSILGLKIIWICDVRKRMNGICQLHICFSFRFLAHVQHTSIHSYWSYFKHLVNLLHSINNLYSWKKQPYMNWSLENCAETWMNYCYFEFDSNNYRFFHFVPFYDCTMNEWLKTFSISVCDIVS